MAYYENCGVCHAVHCKHTAHNLSVLHAASAMKEDESIEETVASEMILADDQKKREADPVARAEDSAAVARMATFIRQRLDNKGPEDIHSWQAKCEVAEATNERLVAERDALRAGIEHLVRHQANHKIPMPLAFINDLLDDPIAALAKARGGT